MVKQQRLHGAGVFLSDAEKKRIVMKARQGKGALVTLTKDMLDQSEVAKKLLITTRQLANLKKAVKNDKKLVIRLTAKQILKSVPHLGMHNKEESDPNGELNAEGIPISVALKALPLYLGSSDLVAKNLLGFSVGGMKGFGIQAKDEQALQRELDALKASGFIFVPLILGQMIKRAIQKKKNGAGYVKPAKSMRHVSKVNYGDEEDEELVGISGSGINIL